MLKIFGVNAIENHHFVIFQLYSLIHLFQQQKLIENSPKRKMRHFFRLQHFKKPHTYTLFGVN